MSSGGAVVVVGGTRAIGKEIAWHYAGQGEAVVLTGQDPANVETAVAGTKAKASEDATILEDVFIRLMGATADNFADTKPDARP